MHVQHIVVLLGKNRVLDRCDPARIDSPTTRFF